MCPFWLARRSDGRLPVRIVTCVGGGRGQASPGSEELAAGLNEKPAAVIDALVCHYALSLHPHPGGSISSLSKQHNM